MVDSPDVDPKRYGSGKGTHLSIYTHLMKGQFDDHLKWPFRGEITIQIVNQDGDHDHVEETIHCTAMVQDGIAGRVTGKPMELGVLIFIAPHTDLGYNGTRKTQYLEDDIIIVRVVRVRIT